MVMRYYVTHADETQYYTCTDYFFTTALKSIFLELKYVFMNNILTWIRRFIKCNTFGLR